MEKNENEDVDSAEAVYSIRIVIPNAEPMEIQIGGSDMVQELYHVMLERDQTCHRTCFKIYYENKPLDHFIEIHNIANIKTRSVFYVVEEPYNVREARVHVRHLRDILHTLDLSDAANGVEFSSFSCLSAITHTEEVKCVRSSEIKSDADCLPPDYLLPGLKEIQLKPLLSLLFDQKICALKNIGFSAFNPPPGLRKMKGDVLYLHVDTCENRRFNITCCTRGFFVNATTDNEFNPEPSTIYCRGTIFHSLFDLLSELSSQFRKAFAQLLKLRVERHVFERLPTSYQTYSWLVPTLDHFQDQIRADDLTQPHRIGLEDHVPGQIRDWNEELQTTHDMSSSTFSERLCRDRAKFKVYSDFLIAAIRGVVNIVDGSVLAINAMDDPKTHMFIWNNIFFSLGFDVKDHYKDFGGDAAAFAAATADLNAVRAYAAIDNLKLHTLGMAIIDYRGLRLTAQSIIPGILERDQEESVVYGSFDSGKTVVSSPAYEEILKNSAKILHIAPHKVWNGKKDGEYVHLYSSYESKGIIGNDGRHYLLDLPRTFPPDVNFLNFNENLSENGEMFPRNAKHKLVTLRQELVDSFLEYRYTAIMEITSLLVRKYCLNSKTTDDTSNTEKTQEKDPPINELATAVVKEVQEKIETIFKEKNSEEIQKQLKYFKENFKNTLNNETNDLATNSENSTVASVLQKNLNSEKLSLKQSETNSKVLAQVTKILSSLSSSELDVRFNPDCYCKVVKHAPEEDLVEQRKLISSAANFLLMHQIPLFVKECLNQSIIPIDGCAIVESMHARGINVRYVGKLIQTVENIPALDYILVILKVELLSRCVRHFFQNFIQKVDPLFTGSAIAHFLNLLLGSNRSGGIVTTTPAVFSQFENLQFDAFSLKKSSKKKRKPLANNVHQSISTNTSTTLNAEKDSVAGQQRSAEALRSSKKFLVSKGCDWIQLSQHSLWEYLAKDSEERYGLKIDCDSCDKFIEWSGANRLAVLRRVCSLLGIQLISKNYFVEKKAMPFSESDVHNLVPVIKHINPRSQDAHNLYLNALSRMHQGYPRIGYELMLQAHNMMNNIYGPMHSDLALCLRFLARMAFALGDVSDALTQQYKAVMITERCNGIDNFETVIDYINLAHYSFANLHITSALKLIYRARHLLLVIHGEKHLVMSQIDANIGIILYSIQEYELALKFLQNAIQLYLKYDSLFCLKTALLHHVIARVQSCRGDFRAALQMEKETFNIYAKLLGEEHEKTKQSSEYLKHLTMQAVNFQRKMNDVLVASDGQRLSHIIPTINIQPPTLQNIVEILNLFNNFIFLKMESVRGTVAESKVNVSKDNNIENKERGHLLITGEKGNSVVKAKISDFQEETLD